MGTRATQSKFVCPRMLHYIIIIPASQLHFLASKNAELTGRSQ